MNLTDFTPALTSAWPFLVSGAVALAIAVLLVVALTRRSTGRRGNKMSLENKLTFLVAVIIAGVCAQGMGRFFYDKLNFPIELVVIVGGVLELTAFTCALRARRNILDPAIGKAGIDGIAVWVVTALSGVFSAMDADSAEVAVFRLVMPLLAAWLWERGMSIERRRVRGGSTIHWRVTPERVLVWLRIAEPSGRTASEVDAHRRLTRVAKAAAKVRALRRTGAWGWRVQGAERRLDRAMRSAVAHAGLAGDPVRQQALIAQLGSMYNADALADLTPAAPWADLTRQVQPTVFDRLGVPYAPAPMLPPRAGLAVGSPTGPVTGPVVRSGDGSAPDGSGRSEAPQTHRSATQVSTTDQTRPADRSRVEVPDLNGSDPKVPDPEPALRTQTRKATQTGPKKRTRSKPKPKALDRLDEARAADRAYLAEHGRHIPAEKLARALSIGKPAALDLVKQVRGGHIDIAK